MTDKTNKLNSAEMREAKEQRGLKVQRRRRKGALSKSTYIRYMIEYNEAYLYPDFRLLEENQSS